MSWIAAAFAAAFFADIASILAKCGIKTTDSDAATALRTCVVLAMAWAIVAMKGNSAKCAAYVTANWDS